MEIYKITDIRGITRDTIRDYNSLYIKSNFHLDLDLETFPDEMKTTILDFNGYSKKIKWTAKVSIVAKTILKLYE